MKYLAKWFLGFFLSTRYNKNKDQLYFLVWGHIGEAVYALSLLPELNSIKRKKINIITYAPYTQIAELYSDQVERIIVLTKRKVCLIQQYSQSHVCMHKNYIGGGWEWDTNELYLDVPDVYVPGLNYKIKDLKIPYLTKHSLITTPAGKEEPEFVKLVRELNVIEGKSVLLIPYAQSAKEMSKPFWEKIVKILHEAGLKVYTNVKDDTEKPIAGSVSAVIPLRYVTTFIQYAGSAISIRCGLTDLVAVSDSDVEVLYKVEDEIDEVLAGIWTYKLGKENLLYRRKWLFRDQGDEEKFYVYLTQKYKQYEDMSEEKEKL